MQVAFPAGPVGITVGGDDALIDAPGRLDLDMLVDGEHRLDPRALPVSRQRFPGVQGAADPVERIAGMPAMAESLLLDALPGAVEGVAGELDDVERVHHLDRVREGFGGGGLEAGEPVHRDHLDPVPERCGLLLEPGLEHRFRETRGHVQRPQPDR